MKRLIYIFATLIALTVASCNPTPEVDEKMEAMDSFMETQELPGLYRESQVEYAYNESKNQCYLNMSKLTYRIMDDGGDKYLQFTLSKEPVLGESVDVLAKSYGLALSSNTTYKNLKVEKLENNRCTLRSTAEGGYVGIILDWITE